MFDGRDLDSAERRVDEWQAGFEQRAAGAKDLAGRLAQLSASARSADGLVEVTVGSSGAVTDVRLDEDIRQRPAKQTAREIVRTIGLAQAALSDRVTAAVAETVGENSETGRAIVASFTARHAVADGGRGE